MKAVGVIAEYNPFHNGHAYHLEQARLLAGADGVVTVMSGSFVQRGEPAVMDKWTRTGHALRGGADLVIEIPALFCLGNAGQYAEAGVRLLESTGKVSSIAFGSESGEVKALSAAAAALKDHEEEINERIRSARGIGLSYPAARARALAEVCGDDIMMSDQPNDILGIEYIKAMCCAEPLVIKREGAGHTDTYDESAGYQSASAIRNMVFEGKDVSGFVPVYTAESLKGSHLTDTDRDGWFDALRYAVLASDTETIEDCPSGGEGLANLLKAEISHAESWADLIVRVKSRRYTYTRISRLCMQLLLGITRSRYDDISRPGYIRVLGFNERGRELLAEMRDEGCAGLPVIINVNKSAGGLGEEASKLLALDMHAADIYNLMTGSGIGEGSDHVHAPVIIK